MTFTKNLSFCDLGYFSKKCGRFLKMSTFAAKGTIFENFDFCREVCVCVCVCV